MHVVAHTYKQPPQAVISIAGYGLTGNRLQPAWLKNLYGGLQLRETTAAALGSTVYQAISMPWPAICWHRVRVAGLCICQMQWANSKFNLVFLWFLC